MTRKHELLERQQVSRSAGGNIFGGFSTVAFGGKMPRIFSSPGPIYEPEGGARDYWRMARAIHAAGFRSGELIHNCFSYHFVPAGSMMETGAHALGCTVFAGGTGQTEQQVQAIVELQPAGYIGTPSFLKIIVDKAAEDGRDPAQSDQGHVWRRSLSAVLARLVCPARHCGLPVLRHGQPGLDCI